MKRLTIIRKYNREKIRPMDLKISNTRFMKQINVGIRRSRKKKTTLGGKMGKARKYGDLGIRLVIIDLDILYL